MLHRPALRHLCIALAASVPLPALAQSQPVDAAPANPSRGAEPSVQRTVIEDDNVRIEEVKVRGQVQSIRVQSKARGAGGGYEISTGAGGIDPSQDRRASGQSRWHLFSF